MLLWMSAEASTINEIVRLEEARAQKYIASAVLQGVRSYRACTPAGLDRLVVVVGYVMFVHTIRT